MAAFNSVYIGSRSSRGTEMRALDAFWVVTGGGTTGCLVAGMVDDEFVPVRAAGSICIVFQGQKGPPARGAARSQRRTWIRPSCKRNGRIYTRDDGKGEERSLRDGISGRMLDI